MTPAQAQGLLGRLTRKFYASPPPDEREFWMRRLEALDYNLGFKVVQRLGGGRTWPTGADFDRVLAETTGAPPITGPRVLPDAAPARRLLDRTENASRARQIRDAMRERMRG